MLPIFSPSTPIVVAPRPAMQPISPPAPWQPADVVDATPGGAATRSTPANATAVHPPKPYVNPTAAPTWPRAVDAALGTLVDPRRSKAAKFIALEVIKVAEESAHRGIKDLCTPTVLAQARTE